MTSVYVTPSRPLQNYGFLSLDGTIFTSGQPIYGVAAMVLQKELQGVKRIYLNWEGVEHTGWTKPNGEQVSAERLIFTKNHVLWEPESEVDDRIFDEGSHSWPFEWVLPSDIPASFHDQQETVNRYLPQIEAAIGYLPQTLYSDKPNITYSVSLLVETDVPADSAGLKFFRTFRVTQRLDPSYARMEPLTKQIDKTFLFTKGTLNFKVILPRGPVAFRGRNLPLRVEIQNGPRKKLDTITMTVFQTVIFNAKGEMQQRRSSSFMGVTSALEEQTTEPPAFVYRDLLLNIPNDTDPSITLGTLIQRHYELTVELSVFMGSASVSLPIQMYDPNELDRSMLPYFPPAGGAKDPIPVIPATPEIIPPQVTESEFNAATPDESVLRRKKKEEKKNNVLSLLAVTPTISPPTPEMGDVQEERTSEQSLMKKSPSMNGLSHHEHLELNDSKPRNTSSMETLTPRKNSGNLDVPKRRGHMRSTSLQLSPKNMDAALLMTKKDSPTVSRQKAAFLERNPDMEEISF
ncbi:hypothetical protein PROFUN_10404 [Planoprotostelium fungivorum]|uniref:Arrestin C-terminal-like domain-containing protein n=1 Tax=Planoprotostelium fungivorum TaxID=1890364 RepID=A0A2P6NE38_9EUKA|nr:hypothetical protein PROFUN_10404 [Planoprotostelium fungivorum]